MKLTYSACIVGVLVLSIVGLATAQSIHVEAGYFVPDKGLKGLTGNGPIGSLSFIPQSKLTAPILVEISASYWQTIKKNAIRVRMPEVSWAVYVPVFAGDEYFFGPGAGVMLTSFRASAAIPALGSGYERIFTNGGGKVSLLGIYRDITLKATYKIRSIEGLSDKFKFGGVEVAAGYMFHF